MRFPVSRRAVLFSVVAVLAMACGKTVSVDLALIEPCDQKNQALNGISSFSLATQSVSEDGTAAGDIVTFTAEAGPPALDVGLGDVTVEVKAFADDVTTAGAASALPKAVGRTMPLSITAQSSNTKAVIMVGNVDTFGRTTNAAGECTSMTADAPLTGRHGHTATFVPVLNQVLIVGGAVFLADGSESFLASAELWDPATGAFASLGLVGAGRAYHAATALPDGRVLISGGIGTISGQAVTLQLAEIFDPIAQAFSTMQLRQPRAHHTSTLMEGAGLVALVGGCKGDGAAGVCTTTQAGAGNAGDSTDLVTTVETFDIAAGTTATVAVPSASGLAVGRAFHQATSLENGSATLLVVTGGANADGPVCGIELFRADGGSLSRLDAPNINVTFPTTPSPKCPVRHAAVSVLGADSQPKVLIIGGQSQAAAGRPAGPGQVDVFEFTTLSGLAPLATLVNARAGHQAARLLDNSVIIVGGSTGAGPTAEILRPAAGTGSITSSVLQSGPSQARENGALAVLPSNQVLFTGGSTLVAPVQSVATAELFFGP